MASVAGMIGRGCGSSSWIQLKNSKKKKAMRKNDRVRVCTASYSASSAVTDPYKTLRIQPGASESEVKKAFRQLALHNCYLQYTSGHALLRLLRSSTCNLRRFSFVYNSKNRSERNVVKGARAARIQRNKMMREQKRAALLNEKRASSVIVKRINFGEGKI